MRRTLRQLAAAKPARYLEPGTPTGLAGLLTHPAPRPTLLYLYSSTLDKLQSIPESSLYRQSVEAVTKQRMGIVQGFVPEGYEAWATKARGVVEEHPEVFNTPKGSVAHDEEKHVRETKGGREFVVSKVEREVDELVEEWDGEEYSGGELEGTRSAKDRVGQGSIGAKRPGSDYKSVQWEKEPPLNVEQISELENKIGAGLIEEVIQVAEGELKLVDTLLQAKVWEDLEEKPAEGQWSYFQRSGTPGTPPSSQK